MFREIARQAMRQKPSQFDLDLMQMQAQRASAQKRVFLTGLSISQGAPCGVAVLERFKPPEASGQKRVATYVCRYLCRWLPPATAYPILISELAMMLQGPLEWSDLIVEAGPSIRPVVALLRKHRLRASIRPVEVKVSAEDTYVGDTWRVGKGSLIETTRQVLQEERMTFDEQMSPEVMASTPSVRTIYQALLTYPFERVPSANEAFAAREGEYDDLVLAVTLACWYGEHCRKEFWIR